MLFLCLKKDIHNLIYITALLTNANLKRSYRCEQKLFPENPTLTLLQEFATKAFRFSSEISVQAGKMRPPSFLKFKAWGHVAL